MRWLSRSRWSLVVLTVGMLSSVCAWHISQLSAADVVADPAVERTRKQVKMLDDLYKTAVVLITEHYVNKDTDLPAGSAALALFDAMKKKGWHEVRLVDATGKPITDSNAPKDEFEKAAIAALKAGKGWHEEVTTKDGKKFLRAATPVPVVMKKCVMCHAHYADAKKDEAIGSLMYVVPVE